MAKLRRQVRRTKEILSANTAAPISVEELHGGKDFQSSISRDDFEKLAGPFWERAKVLYKVSFQKSMNKVTAYHSHHIFYYVYFILSCEFSIFVKVCLYSMPCNITQHQLFELPHQHLSARELHGGHCYRHCFEAL